MPKYYEPEGFEKDYRSFLEEKIKGNTPKKVGYIDPDSVAHVDEIDFYNDLTDFLNRREEEYWDKKRWDKEPEERYYYLPPIAAKRTSDWLKDHENMKEWMSGRKIAVVGKKRSNDEQKERLFCLTSDQFGFSAAESIYGKNFEKYPLAKLFYSYAEKDKDEKEKIIGRIVEYVKSTRTIGGSFLWPISQCGKCECNYNKNRGVGGYLEDRVDLTLLEIKHAFDTAYENGKYQSDILYNQYIKDNTYMKVWLKHFGSFKNYVEYFMLEPFCQRVIKGDGKDYAPINIIDGIIIDDNETPYSKKYKEYTKLKKAKKAEEAKKFKEENGLKEVKDLNGAEVLKMLDCLEEKIRERSENMEKAIESYREN